MTIAYFHGLYVYFWKNTFSIATFWFHEVVVGLKRILRIFENFPEKRGMKLQTSSL